MDIMISLMVVRAGSRAPKARPPMRTRLTNQYRTKRGDLAQRALGKTHYLFPKFRTRSSIGS